MRTARGLSRPLTGLAPEVERTNTKRELMEVLSGASHWRDPTWALLTEALDIRSLGSPGRARRHFMAFALVGTELRGLPEASGSGGAVLPTL